MNGKAFMKYGLTLMVLNGHIDWNQVNLEHCCTQLYEIRTFHWNNLIQVQQTRATCGVGEEDTNSGLATAAASFRPPKTPRSVFYFSSTSTPWNFRILDLIISFSISLCIPTGDWLFSSVFRRTDNFAGLGGCAKRAKSKTPLRTCDFCLSTRRLN